MGITGNTSSNRYLYVFVEANERMSREEAGLARLLNNFSV